MLTRGESRSHACTVADAGTAAFTWNGLFHFEHVQLPIGEQSKFVCIDCFILKSSLKRIRKADS